MRRDIGYYIAPGSARQWFAPGAPLELWGRKEVADYLGCKQQNLPVGLPDPLIDYLSRGNLWLASDIREFAEGRGAA